MTKALATLAVLAAAGLAIAGCGSSGGSGTTGSESAYGGSGSGSSSEGRYGEGSKTASASPEATGAAVVSAAQTNLGKVMVDSKGFTLYLFKKDKGSTSSCYGPCAEFWPPLTTEGKPQSGEGAMAAKLGTTQRKDGTEQVTYAGHPLYTYEEDKKPGDTKGEDVNTFGGQWYAVFPSGEQAGH